MDKGNNLDWLSKVDLRQYLPFEHQLIYDAIGFEAYLKMTQAVSKMTVYFTERPIELAKRDFVMNCSAGMSAKEICTLLDMSEKTVYRILSEKTVKTNQLNLLDGIEDDNTGN